MSFSTCIDAAQAAGKISKDVAERLKKADNPDVAIDNVLTALTRQKRETAIQAVRIAEGWERVQSHPRSLYDGLVSLLTKDQTGKAGYANVEYLAKTYEARFQSRFADALSVFRTRTFGLTQDTERLHKLIKAIYGEAVDDTEVTKFAKQWNELTEEIRTEFNAKGGSISKNEKWLMPQNHDFRALQKVGKEKWVEHIKPLLDRNQMLDDFGRPLDDDELQEALDYVFDTITTHGLNKTQDFSVPRLGRKLTRKGAERRFLYFKNADSWIEYNKEFGKGDIFTTLTDHVSVKSNDIAMMEVMGTSPDSTWKTLKSMVEKSQDLTQRQKVYSDAVWNVVSGKINGGELTSVADFFQATRNVLTASTLGSAFLSSISDVGMQVLTTRFNGVPAFRTLSRQMALLNPANEADRIFSVKMGLTAEGWLGRAQAANRYSDVFGTGPTTKVAEGVMRASLLQPWTDAGRKAFGMEFGAVLADNFPKKYGELDKKLVRAFKRYGIAEQDWDSFRKSKPLEHKGAKYADMTQKGGVKFHQMVMSETDFAVPTPDAKVRAITTGGIERGSATGQMIRSIMNLKSFPITIATTHFYRAAYQATMGEKLGYAAALFSSMTALGAIALQAKDLAAGREPRPTGLEDGDFELARNFLGAAMLQGGGAGIFGDFLFSDVNRFGGGPIETAFGPTGELASKTLKLTVGNVQEAIKGEETNILGESAQFLQRYTPDIWQTRLFTDAVFDQLTLMADPRAQKKFNRMMRSRQKEYSQGYWWRKGEILPEAIQ